MHLFALPARLGSLGITYLTKSCEALYLASVSITNSLASLISAQENIYPNEYINAQLTAKSDLKKKQRIYKLKLLVQLRILYQHTCKGPCLWPRKRGPQAGSLPTRLRNLVSLYTSVPFGMPLRSDMADCFCIAHLIVPVAPPFLCSMPCPVPKEGFLLYVTMIKVRDLTAKSMTEVYHDVHVEYLQPVTAEVLAGASSISTDGARLDVAVKGFWGGRHEQAFFDIRVFNPLAKSNNLPILSCYHKHENEKNPVDTSNG